MKRDVSFQVEEWVKDFFFERWASGDGGESAGPSAPRCRRCNSSTSGACPQSSTPPVPLVVEGVEHVEKATMKHAFTSIIHGKVKHEETPWPPSSFPFRTYLVVLGLTGNPRWSATTSLARQIAKRSSSIFAKACSPGFRPETRPPPGLAVAQIRPRMLKSRTEKIGRMVSSAPAGNANGPSQLERALLAFQYDLRTHQDGPGRHVLPVDETA